MNSHKSCLVCQSSKLAGMPLQYAEKGLTKCSNCGFVFMLQIPSEEELNDFYSKYSYASEGYLPPMTVVSYNKLLDEFEGYNQQNTILDIGAGRGWFLEEARKRGWRVYATEYSETAVELMDANGINAKSGALNPHNFEGVKFDIITSFEVIEHINNPKEELSIIYDLLRNGGLFYCTTPNFNSAMRYYLKSAYNIIFYPEHLSYYTKSTLNRLLIQNGFKKRRLLTTGISLSRISSSVNHGNERSADKGSKDEMLREALNSNVFMKLVKDVVNFFLSITGLGMTLKAYYIKNGD